MHHPLPLIVLTAPWSHSTRFELARRISPVWWMTKVPASTHQAGPSPRRNPASLHYPLPVLGPPQKPTEKSPRSKTHRKRIPAEKCTKKNSWTYLLQENTPQSSNTLSHPHSLPYAPTHPPRHPPTQAPTHPGTRPPRHPPTQAPTHPGTYSLLTCLLTH